MKLMTTIAALLAFALVAGACGGDDDGGGSAEDQALIQAIAAEFDEDPPPGVNINSECMAKGFVDELGGAEEIEEKYGVTADNLGEIEDLNLDQGAATSIVDTIWGCADFENLVLEGFGGSGIADDQASCLLDAIGEDPIKKLFAAGLMGDSGAALEEEASEEMFDLAIPAIVSCDIDV